LVKQLKKYIKNEISINQVQFPKQNYFKRRTKPKGPRINNRIRALEVQVIGSDKKNLGTLPTKKAVEMAQQEGLDLIEISPKANPPVCKITDFGKYRYDLQKKLSKSKKNRKLLI
jgi:translation initiation factor IF-3